MYLDTPLFLRYKVKHTPCTVVISTLSSRSCNKFFLSGIKVWASFSSFLSCFFSGVCLSTKYFGVLLNWSTGSAVAPFWCPAFALVSFISDEEVANFVLLSFWTSGSWVGTLLSSCSKSVGNDFLAIFLIGSFLDSKLSTPLGKLGAPFVFLKTLTLITVFTPTCSVPSTLLGSFLILAPLLLPSLLPELLLLLLLLLLRSFPNKADGTLPSLSLELLGFCPSSKGFISLKCFFEILIFWGPDELKFSTPYEDFEHLEALLFVSCILLSLLSRVERIKISLAVVLSSLLLSCRLPSAGRTPRDMAPFCLSSESVWVLLITPLSRLTSSTSW